MRTHVVSAPLAAVLLTTWPVLPARAQDPAQTERATPAPTLLAQPQPGEREIKLEREHPLEVMGLPRPEGGGFRFSGFFVGSASYNSHIQMVPEFAGGAQSQADARSVNFRFDSSPAPASSSFARSVYRTRSAPPCASMWAGLPTRTSIAATWGGTTPALSWPPRCSSPSARSTAPSAWPFPWDPMVGSRTPGSSS